MSSLFSLFLGKDIKTADDPTGLAEELGVNLTEDKPSSGAEDESSEEEEDDEDEDGPIVESEFYPRTLLQFNGVNDDRIFISIKGKVYDCTKGAKFYGPDGPYENFAGHDASRGLAINSFDPDVIQEWDEPIDDLSDLTEKEQEALDSWEDFFENKYPCVGTLIPEPGINDVE